MSLISWIPLYVCAVLYMQSATAKIDLGFPLCDFDDSACNAKNAKLLLNKYAETGVGSLKLMPIDPMHITSLKLPPNPNSAIQVGLLFKNIDLRGLSNAQNIKVDGFTRNVTAPLTLGCTVPKATFSGYYEGDGTILGVKFQGKGNCVIEITDISLTCKINAKLVQKNGKNYLDINKVSLVLSKPKNVHYQFDGLYDGSAELGATANEFLNANWYEIFEGMRPGIQETFELIVHEYIKNVFSLLPYEDLFNNE